MVNVLAPIPAKLLLIENLSASIAVRIPTKAQIPIAIIRAVRIVRMAFALIEEKATFIFSENSRRITQK
jgi:hypothetical protein